MTDKERAVTVSQSLMAARDEAMAPHLPWFRGEPVVRIPLDFIKIDQDRQNAYVTFADLAKAFAQES
jgi:hypothetical protein